MSPKPIRTLLAAADLRQPQDPVLATAALLAGRLGARLHVLHVLGSGHGWVDGASRPELVRRVSEARAAIGAAVGRAGADPGSVEVHVAVGRAHREILGLAGRLAVELVVVGANRGGAVGAHFLGSTAERVVHGSPVPCMVVRTGLALPIGSVAVPTDAFAPSEGAVLEALRWSVLLGTPGSAPPVRVVYAGWHLDVADDPSVEERLVLPALRAVAERCPPVDPGEGPSPAVTVEVVWGDDPPGELARWAAREGVGLMVLASRGEGGLRRLLAGSVAQSIARSAPCPVLLLPSVVWRDGAPASDGRA
jgi:nucleotide-binding universal stress UspA family protein